MVVQTELFLNPNVYCAVLICCCMYISDMHSLNQVAYIWWARKWHHAGTGVDPCVMNSDGHPCGSNDLFIMWLSRIIYLLRDNLFTCTRVTITTNLIKHRSGRNYFLNKIILSVIKKSKLWRDVLAIRTNDFTATWRNYFLNKLVLLVIKKSWNGDEMPLWIAHANLRTWQNYFLNKLVLLVIKRKLRTVIGHPSD
jgi:hypothetical protein